MANKKISELNSATLPLDNTELVPIVQGGETKKVALSDLKSDKQDVLTPENLGTFIYDELSIKVTPSADDEILTYDSITGEAVTIKYSDFPKFDIFDLQKYSIYAWRPLPNGWYGFSTPTVVGTADNQSPLFTGNDFIKAVRRRYVSASTAGSSVEFYEQSFRQTSIGDGFFFSIKFGNEDAVAVADARVFAGFAGLSVIGNINPSTQANIIGVGADSGDTNLSFMHNDSTGTAVKVSLGASFPANTIATDLYCLQIYNVRGQNSIWYRVLNVTSNVVTTWTQITTELPASNQILLPKCWRNNGTTALAVRLSLVDMTIYKNI